MSKPANNKKPKKNSTEERLRATPFESVEELDRETENIRLSVWRRVTEAQIIDELLTKPESKFLLDEWKAGLICYIGTDTKDAIFKIFSDGHGLQLQLNPDYAKSMEHHEVKFIEGVVRAGIEGYGALYMRAKSILQSPDLHNTLAKIESDVKPKNSDSE